MIGLIKALNSRWALRKLASQTKKPLEKVSKKTQRRAKKSRNREKKQQQQQQQKTKTLNWNIYNAYCSQCNFHCLLVSYNVHRWGKL